MKFGTKEQNSLLCPVLLLMMIYAVAGQEGSASSTLRFSFSGKSLVVVPVKVNGEGPFDFLLDTGTNTTIVTPELALRLNLRATGRLQLNTLSGTTRVPWSNLDLTLGAKSIQRVETIFAGLNGVRSACQSIVGVLGQNFLARFNYMLD